LLRNNIAVPIVATETCPRTQATISNSGIYANIRVLDNAGFECSRRLRVIGQLMNDSKSDLILEKLQSYIEMRFLVEFDGETITTETDLFQAGIVDSFGIVDIISFAETSFDISFTESDLTSPALASLGGLLHLIKEHRAA